MKTKTKKNKNKNKNKKVYKKEEKKSLFLVLNVHPVTLAFHSLQQDSKHR